MSENKHTPEPWRTDAECGFPQDIHDSKGNLFLRCGSDFDNEIYGEANARRIVACVNACAGISTENLEDNVPIKELARRYNETLKQRDELLAALEKMNRAYVILMESARDRICDLGGECDGIEVMERNDPYLRESRAAIASVKGEQ